MITETESRCDYIGGSECNIIYMGYHTKTFRNWWNEKLQGIVPESPSNIHMSVGTILESDILDLYESEYNVKGIREDTRIKGIARANTDYLLNGIVIDVKCTKDAEKWFKKGSVPIKYKRQLLHYCHVYDLQQAGIIAYQTDEDLLSNPFKELDTENLYYIPVEITEQDIQTHKEKIEFLSYCKKSNIMP